jgi:hypothetical protein
VAPPAPPLVLPLALRNRLAALILESLRDARARRILEALAARREPDLADWLGEAREHAAAVSARAARAARALPRAPAPALEELRETLADAAALFDAGLYFEVHELLEPRWIAATGTAREALQGLIQIAVGYQHLANGNLAGARALLADGGAKIAGRAIEGIDLGRFAEAVRGTITRVGGEFDWTRVPRFPRGEAE